MIFKTTDKTPDKEWSCVNCEACTPCKLSDGTSFGASLIHQQVGEQLRMHGNCLASQQQQWMASCILACMHDRYGALTVG